MHLPLGDCGKGEPIHLAEDWPPVASGEGEVIDGPAGKGAAQVDRVENLQWRWATSSPSAARLSCSLRYVNARRSRRV